MYKSVVNDNAEDFPKVAVKFVSTLWFGDQILGKMSELRMMLKSFGIANWNMLSAYLIISLRIPSTPQAFLGWRVFILSCDTLKVIGEFSGFWSSLIVYSKISI